MLPLIVKDYAWRQTEEKVFITVKIKNIKKSKTSLLHCDNYIRVFCPPDYFEVFLWGNIKTESGKCTLVEEEDLVVFELQKSEPTHWPKLEKDPDSLNRTQKHEIRTRAVELTQKRATEEIQAGLSRRESSKNLSVQEQMRLDDESRRRVASIRSLYSEKTMDEFTEWKQTQEKTNQSGDAKKVKIPKPKEEKGMEKLKTTDKIPPIRQSGKIQINFTPREFPTPSRESTQAEEDEWLKKQADARKLLGFDAGDLRPEENDPDWLLQKGESLYQSGNYEGAVTAFSTGIKIAPKIPDLYVKRAGAHLELGNVRKTVEDASHALELLQPKVPSNAKCRLDCHSIRASGFISLKMFEEATIDLSEALKIDPENLEIKNIFQECKKKKEKEDLESED